MASIWLDDAGDDVAGWLTNDPVNAAIARIIGKTKDPSLNEIKVNSLPW